MRLTAAKPATTPMPVQLAASEFTAFLFPHLSMPKRGPTGTRGYHRVFHLILWGLYTGMQWQCWPIPHATQGKPAMHSTTIYKVLATWAGDGSRWQAFVASVAHLAQEKPLALGIRHGDGTHTVAKQGGMVSRTRGTNPSKGRRASRSRTPMALS